MDRNHILSLLRGILGAIMIGLLCAACAAQPTPAPQVEPTIAFLLTEQAQLGTQISSYDQERSTPIPAGAIPSPTLKPSVTPTITKQHQPEEQSLPLQAIYFIGLDENLHKQIYRIAPGEKSPSQISSFENGQEISDFDVSNMGDLVYVLNYEDTQKPSQLVRKVSIENTEDVIYTSEIRISATGESIVTRILHPRWSLDGESIFFTREYFYPDQVSVYTELIQFFVQSGDEQLILSDQDGTTIPVAASVYTNEALEYVSGNQWNKEYKVTQTSPDGRYILIQDTVSSLWSLYDLQMNVVKEALVFGNSGALFPNGDSLLIGGMAAPGEQTKLQSLTQIDFSTSSTNTYLSFPEWNPNGLIFDENFTTVYFYEVESVDGLKQIRFFQFDLSSPDKEPFLIRSETLPFTSIPTSTTLASTNQIGWIFYGPTSDNSEEFKKDAIAIVEIDTNVPVALYGNINVMSEIQWGP